MEAVMLSIQPKWCELIASGKKTIEMRKTAPKLETPFKCYIYCTASDVHSCLVVGGGSVELFRCCNYKTAFVGGGVVGNGTVIGEFVCDRIDRLYIPISTSATPPDKEAVEKATCLSLDELKKYANGKMFLCGWHISDLKIYDTPKELDEFKTLPCEKPESACDNCKYKVNVGTYWEHEWDCYREDGTPLTRPPQSWCYVEELSE